MKILFEVGLPSHKRHFSNVIAELEKRGHQIIISTCMNNEHLFRRIDIKHDHREVSSNIVFVNNDDVSEGLSYLIRCTMDCILYLRPDFDNSPILRNRIINMLKENQLEGLKELGSSFYDLITRLDESQRNSLLNILKMTENRIPSSKKIEDFIRQYNPHIMLITPLIVTQYNQVDILKSAKSLGIPVGFPVFSWDNLSTKGLIHVKPDRVFVWNKIQKEEAIKLHGILPQDVVITGAPRFDNFFIKKPEMTRDEFCRKYNLDFSKPIVTYLCSSNLVSSEEIDYVMQWITCIRKYPNKQLCQSNIVIRPHPKFREQWKKIKQYELTNVAVCSSEKLCDDPLLFHCLYYSSAVVGLNTSAEIEAAILGKPVFTINVPEFKDGQSGTIHFHYLLKKNGGFVQISDTLEEHFNQLSEALAGNYERKAISGFVELFLRPTGIHNPASVKMADEIESFATDYLSKKVYDSLDKDRDKSSIRRKLSERIRYHIKRYMI